ncbi:GroES-like protein [Coniophora puteana RWD-64-598 SS2]|uniref:GroES-like protein n=1 Tax=Coniophora puteana (strain RWD-64-598) TaxID=741705 RepID=A0A5M3MZD6_CONPW|nr:GroES-like protein [Coniophora puteana RWD-64-598 SS2]EIW83995.1 GroES-like protein [Coniophora puteana RWD-64-598 SS2]
MGWLSQISKLSSSIVSRRSSVRSTTLLPRNMSTMKAININGLGGLEVLVSAEVPIPTVGPEDVLVNVKAVSINPVEAKIRAGKWAGGNLPAGSILGFDAAGTIVQVGSSVPASFAHKVGDAVWLLGSSVPNKSNAEYLVADYRSIAAKPKSLEWGDAAAIPLVGLTAWELLFEQMRINEAKPAWDASGAEDAILIVNGAGGVGSIASQLARSVAGLKTVITTASREASIKHTLGLGATHTISHNEPWAPQIAALGLPENVKIKYIAVLTTTTQQTIDQALEVIAPRGRIGLAVQGPEGSYSTFGKAQRKGIDFSWGFVFTKMAFKWNLASQGAALTEMAKLVDEGKIKSITSQSLDLTVAGLKQAHELMESGKTVGKVVLTVPAQGAFQ